jgi:hypothetical protein
MKFMARLEDFDEGLASMVTETTVKLGEVGKKVRVFANPQQRRGL